ncbi:MAG: NosD domain-containing protein [Candidatus Bathyarchaeia archaeon]|jgi:parallel beta-helix repeat protein
MEKLGWLLVIVLFCQVILLGSVQFGQVQASETVNGIIASDTTWTQSRSPITLIGPISVNPGVTLTIEAGAIVNLGTYYIQVNGTLQALGTQNNKVQFNGGKIVFTEICNGWLEQSDTGCKIENAVFNQTTITSDASLKIINSQTTGGITVIDYFRKSLLSNNRVEGSVEARNAYILDNQISYDLNAVDSNIVGCTVNGGVSGSFLSIDQSIIGHYSSYYGQSAISLTGAATITNCTISGGGSQMDWVGRYVGEIEAVIISGSPIKIVDSTIYSGLKINAKGGKNIEFSNNVFSGHLVVDGNQVLILGNSEEEKTGSISASGSQVVIQKNIVHSISFSGYSIIACDNTVSRGYTGINAQAEGSAVIERNLITNCTNGIRCTSNGITIQNNTIKNNQVGIYLDHSGPTICYNNFENNKDNIIQTSADKVDAANNYWLPSDRVSIDNSIHDYYDDFNLGKVNFSPMLTQPNPQALPDPDAPLPEFHDQTVSIPEVMWGFPSLNQNLILLLLVPVATVVAAVIILIDALVLNKPKNKPT